MIKEGFLSVLAIAFFSCADQKSKVKPSDNDTLPYKIEVIKEKNFTPTVDIKEYTLIVAQNEDRKKDAEHILDLKRKWPLVMQAPNRIGFDTILSPHFTFTADGQFFNREDYIIDRTKPSDWKITFVKYENLTLQFFGNTALLTYKNQVTNENINTKEIEIEYISWADIYVTENSKWKIGATHTIDVKIEKK